MNETQRSPCEDALKTLRPALARALEESLLESLRSGKLRTPSSCEDDYRMIVPRDLDELARLAAQSPSTAVDRPKAAAVPRKKKQKPPSKPSAWWFVMRPIIFWGVSMMIVLFFYERFRLEQQPWHEALEKPTTPAVVTDLADVQWKGFAPKLGEPLQPGQLAFESGTVELLFYNGVRSVIEGPADLILMNESQVFCRRGNWSVNVPPSGVGFEIQTPGCTVRDHGTQFYAAIDGKNSEVHVLKGAVEVENGKKVLLKTNQAVKVHPGEILDRMATIADFFVPKTEMRRRSNDYWQRHPFPTLPSPRGGGESGGTSPALSVDFSQENPEGVTLFFGSRENGAFRFTGVNSRIRLKPLGKLSSFTVLINVKVDRITDGISPILMSEGTKPGGIVWNIAPNGTMAFGIRDSRGKGIAETPIVFSRELLGQWTLLGLSVDERRGQVSVYTTGDMVCSLKLSNSGPADLNALDLGNWKLKANVGQLNGAVKSVTVFDRALELHEIRLMTNDRSPSLVISNY